VDYGHLLSHGSHSPEPFVCQPGSLLQLANRNERIHSSFVSNKCVVSISLLIRSVFIDLLRFLLNHPCSATRAHVGGGVWGVPQKLYQVDVCFV
jgi:hypothetical protein